MSIHVPYNELLVDSNFIYALNLFRYDSFD